MDEISEKALETSVSLVIQPVAGLIQDAVGLAGGDWLSETRKRNQRRLEDKTRAIFEGDGVEHIDEPNPAIVAPIITAARDETRDELLDVWARLLAAALDPKRNLRFRREFVDAVKQLEPTDVKALIAMRSGKVSNQAQARSLADIAEISVDEGALALRTLVNCGLCSRDRFQAHPETQFPDGNVFISPLGRELLDVVRPASG